MSDLDVSFAGIAFTQRAIYCMCVSDVSEQHGDDLRLNKLYVLKRIEIHELTVWAINAVLQCPGIRDVFFFFLETELSSGKSGKWRY